MIYLLVIAVVLGVFSVTGIGTLGFVLIKCGVEDRAALNDAVQDLQRYTEEKLQEIQSQLNAIQIDKLKVYVQKQADKPKIADLMRVMDLDTEQLAALDEFKDEQ